MGSMSCAAQAASHSRRVVSQTSADQIKALGEVFNVSGTDAFEAAASRLMLEVAALVDHVSGGNALANILDRIRLTHFPE